MGIRACLKHMPGVSHGGRVRHVGYFQTLPPKAYMCPLPYALYEKYAIRTVRRARHVAPLHQAGARGRRCWTSRWKT